ncbi:RHS repeat protein [Streptomyces sp. CJ_13]|uniref:DUF6531 domain-containing protein n=1 Tax=Streptomyces sp. CJ_13 TaxID=2724943 RepID=UPI001BDCE0D5|nr:DUF6531 domain-containing protein [Streptomyces sp. CJ_13]MBT1185191.1 RHS repeat protein [Streptomyces sp. CJ_13]
MASCLGILLSLISPIQASGASIAPPRPNSVAQELAQQKPQSLVERRRQVREDASRPAGSKSGSATAGTSVDGPSGTRKKTIEAQGSAGAAADPAEDRVSGVPVDAQVIGPEGTIRAIVSGWGAPPSFNGQVFLGETVTLSTGMESSENHFSNGSWLNYPHQVKVTWEISCAGRKTVIDLGQVVTAPSTFYVGQSHDIASVPYARATLPITPEVCPGTGLINYVFGVKAIGTVIDTDPASGDSSGALTLVPEVAAAIPDGATMGCGTDCSTTGFAQPQNLGGNGTVNTATGAFSLSSADLAQAASGGGWAASRHYASNNPSSGSLGRGWSVPWDSKLAKDPATGNVTYTSDAGSTHEYVRKSSGEFTAPGTSRSVLQHLDAGGYTLTTLEKRVLTFDESGRLLSDKDRSGQGQTYGYNGNRVTSISGSGTTTTLNYTQDRLTRIVRSDGREVTYGYSAGMLTSVTVAGAVTEYAYDTSFRLISVKDAKGRFSLRNAFDSQGRVLSQTDAAGAVTTYAYNGGETDTTLPDGGVWTDLYARNHLLAQYDPFGNRTDYSYDGKSNLTRVTDPMNNTRLAAYDTAGRLTSTTAPDNTVQRYTYTNGNLITAQDGRGNKQTYDYDAANHISSLKDALGNTTTFTYTPSGQLKTAATPSRRTTQFGYDDRGNTTSATSPLGARTTATYNEAGLPLTVTDARGNAAGGNPADHTTTYGYDSADRVLSVKNPKGQTTVLASYDEVGNLKTVTDAAGRVTTHAYDPANRLSTTTGPGGITTAFAYDAVGRLTSRTDAVGGKTTYSYDKAGRLTAMTTPRGNAPGATPSAFTWSFGYDKVGNRTSTRDPDGRVTTTAYDVNSRAVAVTDPAGNTTKAEYDGADNVTKTTDPLGKVTTFTFDKVNQLTSLKDRNSKNYSYTYDSDGNPASETSPLGFKITFEYDADGQQVARTDPRGNVAGADPASFTWRTGYDAVGNVTSETDPLGNKITNVYDALGNLAERSDPLGNKTRFGYDALNRLIQSTAPDGGVAKATFDARGYPTTRTDANQHVSTFEYDNVGRRTKATDALGRSTQYAYDADGNRVKITNARGQTMTSTFDSRGLLTSTSYSDGTPKISYAYNGSGLPTTLVDGTGTRTVTYDAADRPLTITAPGSTNPFKYAYRADGSLSSRTYPDGRTTSYAYDADGRIASQTQNGRATTYGWDEAGNLLSTALPTSPNTTEARTYDNAGRLASLTEGSGVRKYTRNASGQVSTDAYTTAGSANPPRRYEYDSVGRVTRVCDDPSILVTCTAGATGGRYAYDQVGNLKSITDGTSTTTHSFDAADQLTSVTAGSAVTSLAYDADGNQTKDGAGSYAYDALGRVKSATVGADTFSLAYDGDGLRTSVKKNGALLRSSQWDVNNPIPRIATETSATGSLLGDYQYGPGGVPQAVDTAASSFYFLHDQQNSVTSVRDLTATETYRYSYGNWGAVVGAAGGGTKQPSPFGFTGAVQDSVFKDRIQLPARGLDVKAGRFTTPDPRPETAQAPNASTYAYANNDPVNQSDPSGACPLCVSAGIGAAFGAVVEGGIYTWQHRDGGFTGWGLAKAAGRGAVVGGIAGLLMPGAGNLAARSLGLAGGRALATSAAVNAGVGAGLSYAVNSYNCRPTGPWDLLLGAVGGSSSSLVGPAVAWFRGMWTPSALVHAYAPQGYIFRGLRPDEAPEVGIIAQGTNPDVPAWQHVVQDNDSPWISFTSNPSTAYVKYGGQQNGMIAVDRLRLETETLDAAAHLPTPAHGYYDFAKDAAFRDSEFLVKWRVEPDAIVKHWPAGTPFEQILDDISKFRRY